MPATVKKGSEGADVRYVQETLSALYWPTGREDGVFDDATEVAVKMFQRHIGIGVDGIVGTRTYAGLERALRETRGRVWGRGGVRRSPVDLGPLGGAFEGLEVSIDDLVVKLGAVEDGIRARALGLAEAVGFLARQPALLLAYFETLLGAELATLPESAKGDADRAVSLAARLAADGPRRRLGETLEQVVALQAGGRAAEIGTAVRALFTELGASADVDGAFLKDARTLAFELRDPSGSATLVVTGSGGAIREVSWSGSLGGRGGAEVAAGASLFVGLCRGDAARYRTATLDVHLPHGALSSVAWGLDTARLALGVSVPFDREKDLARIVAGPLASTPGATLGGPLPTTGLWP